MKRVYNFSAGPSVLPESVLEKVQKDLVSYKDAGMSVMEMSHRSASYQEIIDETQKDLRDIMNISDKYEVLFLQGGASTQFAMIPLNLMNTGEIDLVHTGNWTKRAIDEANKYGKVNIVGSSEDKGFTYIPKLDESTFSKNASYFHIATNNTIFGTRFTKIPNTNGIPIIADMSSNILSQEYNVNDFGLIFAGAQKNMGPAGATVVIVRKDLIKDPMEFTPTMLNYKTHIAKASMYNTPPTFPIYVCGLVYKWVKEQGGVKQVEKNNIEKANVLYKYLDESNMFTGTVAKADRSLMNIPFVTGDKELDAKFIGEAKDKGIVNIKGYRTVGGMRASMYNAMPIEGVKSLVELMKDFEVKNK